MVEVGWMTRSYFDILLDHLLRFLSEYIRAVEVSGQPGYPRLHDSFPPHDGSHPMARNRPRTRNFHPIRRGTPKFSVKVCPLCSSLCPCASATCPAVRVRHYRQWTRVAPSPAGPSDARVCAAERWTLKGLSRGLPARELALAYDERMLENGDVRVNGPGVWGCPWIVEGDHAAGPICK